jgi:hypothetical protein
MMETIWMVILVGWLVCMAATWKISKNESVVLPRVAAPVQINLGGTPGNRIFAGDGYVLAVVIFYPESEELSFVMPNNIETEEAVAILRKYKVPV